MKRDEIREGMLEILRNGRDHSAPCYAVGDDLLSYLASVGVAIKSEGELPENPHECICEKYPDLAERGEVNDYLFHAVEDYQQEMIKAGYRAWEPLV